MRFSFLVLFLMSSSALAIDARVLIDEVSEQRVLNGDLFITCVPHQNKPCAETSADFRSGTWKLVWDRSGLSVIDAKNSSQSWLLGDRFVINGSFRIDGYQLEKLEIIREPSKKLWIAHLPIDRYLYGVMTAEVPTHWPIEALKAQAVASRTYFLFKKVERQNQLFDVRSDQLDQVFKMVTERYKPIEQSLRQTRSQVLFDKEGSQVFPAYFHSDCGGHTSQEDHVWKHKGALNRGVEDPYCLSAGRNRWSLSMKRKELTSKLKQAFYIPHGAELRAILPRISPETRAHIVDFMFSGNIIRRVGANRLRKILGYRKLKSTNFRVTYGFEKIRFQGIGFGHGVGLCQWGAQRWARHGRSYNEILAHYYPESRMVELDDKKLRNLLARISFPQSKAL